MQVIHQNKVLIGCAATDKQIASAVAAGYYSRYGLQVRNQIAANTGCGYARNIGACYSPNTNFACSNEALLFNN